MGIFVLLAGVWSRCKCHEGADGSVKERRRKRKKKMKRRSKYEREKRRMRIRKKN